jgi:natural product precursor
MKKLSLSKLNLKANDILQKEQLKTVFGGYTVYAKCCTSNFSNCTGCMELTSSDCFGVIIPCQGSA